MQIKSVDAPTLKRWIESDAVVIVDVRDPTEHAAESIEGAKLVPLATLTKATTPSYKDKKLVVHCALGKRGAKACEKLLAEVPDLEIYNLEGGISAWKAEGYPIATPGKHFLPIYRQAQLIIGVILTISSLLGYLYSPSWFFLTGLIGIGITIGSLTGLCGLTMLMTKMPWNQNEDRRKKLN